jgi:NADP-dependent 3-hydroxy acid dehydrogenase YdfG
LHVAAIRAEGHSAEAHACDITSLESVSTLFASVTRSAPLDVVASTAAVLWLEPFHAQVEEHWRTMLDTNLVGAIRVTQAALGHMLPRQSGHILHVTSTAGRLPIPYLAIYSATKAALAHFLAALRGEYGKSGVRFTELQIGNTDGTEGGGVAERGTSEEAVKHLLRWTGLPSMLTTDDVVDAALYALSTPSHVRIDRLVVRELAEIPT